MNTLFGTISNVELDDDPDLQASFAEALLKILEAFRDNWNKIYEELEKLRQRIANADKEPTYGLHKKKQMPFFRTLKREIFGESALNDGNIVRSPKRRKLTITVERDRVVVVHAPVKTSDDEIARVVNAKRQWILEKLRHPQKYHNKQHPPGKEVVNGESAPYLGRDYRIEIVETT